MKKIFDIRTVYTGDGLSYATVLVEFNVPVHPGEWYVNTYSNINHICLSGSDAIYHPTQNVGKVLLFLKQLDNDTYSTY